MRNISTTVRGRYDDDRYIWDIIIRRFCDTGPAHVNANLYLAVMESPGFFEEALIIAYTYLLDNKAQGRRFVGMSGTHRDIFSLGTS
jgi:hypothetical protein